VLAVGRLVGAAIGNLRPAGFGECRVIHVRDVARERGPIERRDQIKIRTRQLRARFDHFDQPPDAAGRVLLFEASDLGVDGFGDLRNHQRLGVAREIADHDRGKHRENNQIDRDDLERGGAE
jgi:hypothetical protein